LGYEAILSRDYPVIISINFLAAVLTLVGTLVSDLLYMLVDPRIRL
jgi:peptide/nickel transport system permease protein